MVRTGQGTEVPGHRLTSLPPPPKRQVLPHGESPPCPSGAPCHWPSLESCAVQSFHSLCLPLKDLGHLVLVEDEAGVVVPQDGHDTQAQAGSVAAHQIRGLEEQLGLDHAQFVQELAERVWGRG